MCRTTSGGTGSQFYVTLKPLRAFDGQYVAIGRSVMGMSALLQLLGSSHVPCDANSQRPLDDRFMIKRMEVFS